MNELTIHPVIQIDTGCNVNMTTQHQYLPGDGF